MTKAVCCIQRRTDTGFPPRLACQFLAQTSYDPALAVQQKYVGHEIVILISRWAAAGAHHVRCGGVKGHKSTGSGDGRPGARAVGGLPAASPTEQFN